MPEPYHADSGLPAKVRRRLVRVWRRRPARVALDRPMLSFSFDDAPGTSVSSGARLLEARGLKGTYFLCSGLAGQPSPLGDYTTRDEIRIAAEGGHEIACHTFSHMDCGQADGAAVKDEVERNAETLRGWGVSDRLRTFAYPYGDAGFAAKSALADHFSLCRGVHPGLIETGSDLAFAPAIGIEGEDGQARALDWMRRAAERRAWLILFTHGVTETPSPYDATPKTLETVIDAAVADGFEIVTVAEGAERVRTTQA